MPPHLRNMSLNRRSFLWGTSLLALAELIGGCDTPTDFRVELLNGSVPVQLVNRFRRQYPQRPGLNFVPKFNLEDLYQQLQAEAISNSALLVMIGDYWLSSAIREELIEPLNPEDLSQWQQLPQNWQNLVRRNQNGELSDSPESNIWGAPYRWGTTAIAYRVDRFEKLGWTPTDWEDLWRPECKGRISLLNQGREVIGLTLKKLGYSYNTPDLDLVPDLKAQLEQLHQNVLLYDSDNYLKPLILGDTWLAVGWSGDISPQLQRQHNIAIAIPKSGTALWSDVWVKPKATSATNNPLVPAWIDFCWQPEIATQMSLLTGATSPIVWGMARADLPKDLRENRQLLPDSDILERSEFLLPLTVASMQQYQRLWQEIRSVVRSERLPRL